MSEIKILVCGCSFDGYEFTPCLDHPASEELDDEDRCESQFGEDRCPNRAEYQVEEPWTPGRFKQRVCVDCAKSQIDFGYLPVPSPVWSFPDLTEKENAIITKARIHGYSSFFPCMDGSEKQARTTLAGAIGFLEGLKIKAA